MLRSRLRPQVRFLANSFKDRHAVKVLNELAEYHYAEIQAVIDAEIQDWLDYLICGINRPMLRGMLVSVLKGRLEQMRTMAENNRGRLIDNGV